MTRSEIDALYRRFGPLVFRRARTLLRSEDDAAEAVQEVFIRAFGGAERFDGRSTPSTWLYQITTHYCLNRLRDAGRRQELWEENLGGAPVEEVLASDPARLVLLKGLLAEAEPEEAAAAVYVFVDGMSHDEAAPLLGVSRRTVGNLLDRFLSAARKRLGRTP